MAVDGGGEEVSPYFTERGPGVPSHTTMFAH
jgi:hypothetical protein